MARPTKQGVDYFPLDTNFDDKIELLIAEKGALALSVIITIWQLTYQNEGYYIKANQDLALLVKRRILLETDVIEDIIKAAIDRGVFDKSRYEEYNILTSKAIQKRYFVAAKKKKGVIVIENYLIEGVSVCENSETIGIDSGGNTTKGKEEVKEKEEEEEEEKVKELWNTFAEENNLSKVIKLSDTRKQHVRNRLKEKEFDLAEIFERIRGSDFLLGKVKDWKADFDFVFASRNNYLKILEGKYANKGSTGQIDSVCHRPATADELSRIAAQW